MDNSMGNQESLSRTYVALCCKTNFNGLYLKKFKLPDKEKNNINNASWYFLNRFDFTACIDRVITFEDYNNISETETKCPKLTALKRRIKMFLRNFEKMLIRKLKKIA